MTDILEDLHWRGLISQSTDETELRKALTDGPITLYAGFDPTADSLHGGNLVPLLTVRRFQLAGHCPIVLAGGATGLVGDPSGRATERSLNTPERVREMTDRIGSQLAKFVDFTGSQAATLVSNLDWWQGISALELLRDVGKHFPINQMLAKEVVATRLGGAGISYTEFSYQILQAYDFLQLFRDQQCTLQIGGTDQWGNLTAGLDLIRKITGKRAHAFTVPLVTTATGEKLGKSTGGGSIWLDPELTSPYAWYQYWINTDDRDVVRWLKILTFLSRDEIEALAEEVHTRPFARSAQRALARELTTLVHGHDETERVVAASQALFGRGELAELPSETLRAALAEAGLVEIGDSSATIVSLLKETGLCDSLSEARRVIAEGGVSVNNQKLSNVDAAVAGVDLLHGRWLVLRRGKKSVAGVEVVARESIAV